MAWSQIDLDNLEAAIASGERRVRLNNREVEYHSVPQMLEARDRIKAEIERQNGVSSGLTRPRSYRIRTGKGL